MFRDSLPLHEGLLVPLTSPWQAMYALCVSLPRQWPRSPSVMAVSVLHGGAAHAKPAGNSHTTVLRERTDKETWSNNLEGS